MNEAILARLRTPYKYPRLVLEPSFRAGQFDSHGVDVPFVFRYGNRFGMSFVGFDGIGYRTGLAFSDDLIHWQKQGIWIDRGAPGSVTEFNVALTWILRDNNLFGAGRLRRVNGQYVGTYHAYPKPGYESGPAVIGICYSRDLKTWQLEPPCLYAHEGAEWERAGLYKSCLLEHRGTYYLFYNAKDRDSGWKEQIGVATSPDLKRWTRYEGNPILRVGKRGAWDDIFASDPCVLQVDKDLWAMFYYGLSSDGHARDGVAFSRDLLHWEKAPEVLIDVGKEGSIDSRFAHKPSLFWHNGCLYHFYCAVSPLAEGRAGDVEVGERRGIAVATSKLLW